MTSQNRRPLPEMFLPILKEEKKAAEEQPEKKSDVSSLTPQPAMTLFYLLCFCLLQGQK